jgi:hypothetical protein
MARSLCRQVAVIAALPLVVASCGRVEVSKIALPTLEVPTVVEGGLDTPESVLHDAKADVYLVSNIAGSPFGDDGKGFISRVSPEGEIVELRWIDGAAENVTLNAPKGMAIVGDVLYVTDVTAVRKFNRTSGKPLGSIAVEGALFLNDLVAGADGVVYVSDTGMKKGFEPGGSDAIYAIAKDDSLRPVVKSTDLGQPNGLAFVDGVLYVLNWSAGKILKIGADGALTEVSSAGEAQGDGLLRHPVGHWLYSSWAGKGVLAISADGKTAKKPYVDLEAPADIGLDTKRNRLLVPLFNDKKVLIYPLVDAWVPAAE